MQVVISVGIKKEWVEELRTRPQVGEYVSTMHGLFRVTDIMITTGYVKAYVHRLTEDEVKKKMKQWSISD